MPFELSEFLNLEDLATNTDTAGCRDFETPVVSVVLDYEELDSFGDIITDTTVDAFYNM